MKLGFLYAGQGSQHAGMGADLYEQYPAFRAVIDSAEVDFDLKEVSFTDSQGVINQTRYTQPCMVAFAAGLTAVLREKGIVPSAAAGLSLGEYSALHAAGVCDAATAVKLVAFAEPRIPVIFNCLGTVKDDSVTIPELLVRQVQSSVYMEDSIRTMAAMGVDALVEIGPGKALSGFVKKTDKSITTYAVETVEDLEAAVAALKGA